MDRIPVARTQPGGERRRRAIDAALLSAVAWLLYTRVHAPVHLDTARDLLIARDCVEGGACHFEGPLSSFARLAQGATWIHLLEAARWMGASVHAIEATVWGLTAVAAGIVCFLSGRSQGRAGALAAGVVLAGLMPFLVDHPVLWNPSLLALPSVVFFAAQRAFVERRSAAALLTAALALGVIVDVHLVGILLVPGLIAPVIASRPRGARAWLADAACILAAPMLIVASSWRAVVDDGRALADHLGAVAGVILVLAITAAALARRIARGGAEAAAGGTAVAYALFLVGSGLVAGHSVQRWYWAPLAPVLAERVAGVLTTRRRGAWIAAGRVAAGAGVLFVWGLIAWTLLPDRDEAPMWTLADVERCARELGARGWTVGDALRGVDAEYGPLFVSPLSAFLPAGDRRRADRILVEKRRGGAGVALDAGFVAAMIEPPPIDFARGERCVDGACAPLRAGAPGLAGFMGLAYPCRWALDPAPRPDAGYALAYVLPVQSGARLTIEPDFTGGWALSRDAEGRTVVRTTLARGESWRDVGWPPALRRAEETIRTGAP
jgi:hypothetical protein